MYKFPFMESCINFRLLNNLKEEGGVRIMSKRQQEIEASPHRDGLREGVLNDPTGVEIGVKVDTDKVINPAQLSALANAESLEEKGDDYMSTKRPQ